MKQYRDNEKLSGEQLRLAQWRVNAGCLEGHIGSGRKKYGGESAGQHRGNAASAYCESRRLGSVISYLVR
jgi:hypothetical protein